MKPLQQRKQSATDLLIGFPDNPLSRTQRLFPDNYMVSQNGGIASLRRRSPHASLIELHFQLCEEIPASAAPLKTLKDYVKRARSLGYSLIAHAPFLVDKNKRGHPYMPLNFDFVWPVVPTAYTRKPIAMIEDIEVRVLKAPQSCYLRLFRVLEGLGITTCTIHVGRPALRFSKSDWRKALAFLKWASHTAAKHNITLAVETGGVKEKELRDVVRCGCGVNLDTAHLFLDLMHDGKSAREANAGVLRAARRLMPHIRVLHLCQTLAGKDAHLDLLDKRGVITVNDAIVKIAASQPCPPAMLLETMPSPKAVAHVASVARRSRKA